MFPEPASPRNPPNARGGQFIARQLPKVLFNLHKAFGVDLAIQTKSRFRDHSYKANPLLRVIRDLILTTPL